MSWSLLYFHDVSVKIEIVWNFKLVNLDIIKDNKSIINRPIHPLFTRVIIIREIEVNNLSTELEHVCAVNTLESFFIKYWIYRNCGKLISFSFDNK